MEDESQSQRTTGIYTGFEAYRTPSSDDYQRVLNEGLVVPDTNVLLNLYRYNDDARSDLLAVLKRVSDQLWVPHQVMVEFWRNRESAISDPQDTADAAVEALGSHLDGAVRALRTWGNRVATPGERVADLVKNLSEAFNDVTDEVSEAIDPDELRKRRDTNHDVVLRELGPVVEGRIGQSLSPEDRQKAIEEASRRIQAGIPPGYLDKDKVTEEAVGDYLVWEQILREATGRRSDVLLVTGDVKDDWWRRERGEIRGPRLELVRELHDRANSSLYMARPETFLRYAREFLEVDVRDESVQDAERVASLFAPEGGWSPEALRIALTWLDERGWVQAAAARSAIANGGFVSREQVYEIGGYEEDRTLRGFTRPANRITQQLRESGDLPDGADDLLSAIYDPKISYVQASGFRIPSEILDFGTDHE